MKKNDDEKYSFLDNLLFLIVSFLILYFLFFSDMGFIKDVDYSQVYKAGADYNKSK